MVSEQELPSELDSSASERERKPMRIPMRWRTVSFECSVKILAECAGDASSVHGPVRLRIREAVADCCRLEIFCGENGLCGVSAGY